MTMPGPRSILIVEDEPLIAMMLEDFIQSLGHEVSGNCDSVGTALKEVEKGAFDAYVLDIGLPGLDGYALARRLRAHASGAAATFIALTGYGSAGDKHRGDEAGFDHYLVKPADLAELARLLQAG